MCGIIARFGRASAPPFDIAAQLQALRHRGPDAQDAIGWSPGEPDIRAGNGDINKRRHILGHLRLSIIDLSHASDQPFMSDDGRYALSYNGEIYNYRELRSELEAKGHRFVTTSDTEVLLKALIHWGQDCLERLEGMFAFILVDRHESRAWFARDAFGIKPLYMLRRPDEVLFCSEIGPLLARLPALDYDTDSLVHMLRWGQDEANEQTLVRDLTRPRPGKSYSIDLESLEVREERSFFDLSTIKVQDWSFEEARIAVRDAFLNSVDHHMRSDAPLAFSLSGGIDSSAIVCSAHALGRQRVRTFSYTPQDYRISERHWAQMVVDHVGAEATFIEPSGGDAIARLPNLVRVQGEPFAGLSIFAQNEVHRAVAANGVKVLLSGQGADEMLAGYNIYFMPLMVGLMRSGRIAQLMRMARVMQRNYGIDFATTARWLGRALLPKGVRESAALAYMRRKAPWLDVPAMTGNGLESLTELRGAPDNYDLHQILKYSVGNSLLSLLRYEDRNSMSHSIESRVPFLTPALARLFLSLPASFLISKEGVTKHIFREAMRGIVPDAILDRRDKVAFTADYNNWKNAVAKLVPTQASNDLSRFIQVRKFRESLDRQLESDNDDGFALLWGTANLLMFDQMHRAS